LGNETISISADVIRRLAVTKQHLAGELPAKATRRDILSIVRDLAYVQWDPISIVAPSHVISLWARLGNFRVADLGNLLWDEKKLFEHWTPIASIVLTEDYPLYYSLMRRYPGSLSGSWKSHEVRAKSFLAEHAELRKKMLNELKKGPLQLNQFEDYIRTRRNAPEWTPRSDVSHMLFHLLMSGDVMVVGHKGNQNIWGLSEDFLPDWVVRKELTEDEFERQAAQRAIRALGTATPSEINYYFVRGRYRNLKRTLARLQEESTIHRVNVEGFGNREKRYIHQKDVPLVERVTTDAWQPRMSLLSPFDNLICGRDRTNRVFSFDYVHEQFLPQEKRKFGTYLLPILLGDKLIGRIDPEMDKQNERLLINTVHAEPGAPRDKETSCRIRKIIDQLAEFLRAKEVVYTARVPPTWKSSLR
jgi:uncharacterized protein YcaQ